METLLVQSRLRLQHCGATWRRPIPLVNRWNILRTTQQQQPQQHQQSFWTPMHACFSSETKPDFVHKYRPPLQRIPPNLRIDPRSSFAPVRREEAEDDEEFDTSDPDDEEEDDNEEEDEEDLDDDELFMPSQETVYAIPLPERLHVPVHTFFAPEYDSQVGTVWLNEEVFGRDPIRVDLMKRAVNYVRAKKRGIKKGRTKTISEVSGSGKKLRPQKGSGRARVGHSRPPHFRGGAKAHGPKGSITDYSKTKLNKKVRKLAMCHLLSQKLLEGNLIIVNQLYDIPSHKTRQLTKFLDPWNIGGKHGDKCLLIDSYHPESGKEELDPNGEPILAWSGVPSNFVLASSNIPRLTVSGDRFPNAYRILHHKKLIMTLAAVQTFESRLGNMS